MTIVAKLISARCGDIIFWPNIQRFHGNDVTEQSDFIAVEASAGIKPSYSPTRAMTKDMNCCPCAM